MTQPMSLSLFQHKKRK